MHPSDTLHTALTHILCHPTYTNHTFCHPTDTLHTALTHTRHISILPPYIHNLLCTSAPAFRHAYSYITVWIHLIPYIQRSRISSATLHTYIRHSATLHIQITRSATLHTELTLHVNTRCQQIHIRALVQQHKSHILSPYIHKSLILLPPCIPNSFCMSTRGASR